MPVVLFYATPATKKPFGAFNKKNTFQQPALVY